MNTEKVLTTISKVLTSLGFLLMIILFFVRDSDIYEPIKDIWMILFTLWLATEFSILKSRNLNLQEELDKLRSDEDVPDSNIDINKIIETIDNTIQVMPERIAPAAFHNHTTVAMDRAKDFYNDLLLRQQHDSVSLKNELKRIQENLEKRFD